MGSLDIREVLHSFSGKRVFITGHTGFKGSWLTFILKELGAEVMGFSLKPEYQRSHFELLNLAAKIQHRIGDIRDDNLLKNTILSFRPEYVFHLAAQALVKKSYDDPSETFSTNIMGSLNLLDAVRQCDSVRSLVYITSDKCYENVEWMWGYRENDRLGGVDPYSASKAAAELVFSSYARSYFSSRLELGAATTRAGNVIGGGDWAANRIVPDCIRAIEHDLPISLRNPEATRPWQHVLDPLYGYLLLAYSLRADPVKFAGSWNFGPSSSEVRSVKDVALSIVKHFDRGRVELDQAKHLHEANLLQLNCDKAHQLLGWRPRWNVDKALSATSEWYKLMLAKADIEKITQTQVKDYFPEML